MSHTPLRILPFGDRALLVELPDVTAAHSVARAVRSQRDNGQLPGPIEDVVVGFASVLVILGPDPDSPQIHECASTLEHLCLGIGVGLDVDVAEPTSLTPVASHLVAVTFDGEDLNEVAAALGATTAQVVELMVGADLEVAFIGFAPGFPYLIGLPDELAALPRRRSPRTAVPAGSVAVAGGFASVYPGATPGGWNLLGRTSEVLFDATTPPHSRVAPGDRIRFIEVPGRGDSSTAAIDTPLQPRPLLAPSTGAALVVLDPGMLSMVQDAGRHGVAGLGVPRAGAADPRAHGLANRLLGNEPGAGAIECTGSGVTVRVVGAGHVAVVGPRPGTVEIHLDGRSVPDCTVVPVADGQVLSVGRIHDGLRAYLGIAGGLVTPELFGSRSSDVLSGLGPGALRSGDHLARRIPGRVRGTLEYPLTPQTNRQGSAVTLRVLPGPHGEARSHSPGLHVAQLASTPWTVGAEVDRIGVRLTADDGRGLAAPAPTTSTPMVTGAIQLPPDGRPIILLPDHATVGGYPVIACVIAADLPLLGQLSPGTRVEIAVVDAAAAEALQRSARATMDAAVTGWFPSAAGT